jgi:hypothetical protein
MTWDTKCLAEANGDVRGASVAAGRRPSDDVDWPSQNGWQVSLGQGVVELRPAVVRKGEVSRQAFAARSSTTAHPSPAMIQPAM